MREDRSNRPVLGPDWLCGLKVLATSYAQSRVELVTMYMYPAAWFDSPLGKGYANQTT